MTEPMAGGRRRVDRVLAPGFVEGLEDLDRDELRERRDEARAERDYLSFVRRLLHGRRDILRAELDRRRSGGAPPPVLDRLAEILAEGPQGPARGEAPVMRVSVEEVARARRRVERLVSDASLSDLEALSEGDLERSLARIDEEERTVSGTRRRVLAVHDALQEETKRRYRAELGEPSA